MIHVASALLDKARHDPNFLGNAGMHKNHTSHAGLDGLTWSVVSNMSANVASSAIEPSELKAIMLIMHFGFFATPDFKFNLTHLASWQESMGAVAAFRCGDMSFIVGSVPNSHHPKLSVQYHQILKNMAVLHCNVLPHGTHIGAHLGKGQDA